MTVLALHAVRRVAIIGCGLIGGSFALAIRKARPDITVTAYGRSQTTLQEALRMGAITDVASSLPDAVRDADVVLISVPVGATHETLNSMRAHLKPTALVMDAGSTKADMVATAQTVLGENIASGASPEATSHFPLSHFVPAHPIAGKEKAGIAHAEGDLYANRLVILTPSSATAAPAISLATALWEAVGARVIQMDADTHDHVFGAVSHLPHLLAFAYMNGVDPSTIAMGGTGFQDFTRIAGSDPVVWRDILSTNRTEILAQVQGFEQALAQLKSALTEGDTVQLQTLITQASAQRKAWRVPAPLSDSNAIDD